MSIEQQLMVLHKIRQAVGDVKGRLMQDELVERIETVFSERKTVHEWLNAKGVPMHEGLLRRLAVALDVQTTHLPESMVVPAGYKPVDQKCFHCGHSPVMSSGEWLTDAFIICPNCGATVDDWGKQYPPSTSGLIDTPQSAIPNPQSAIPNRCPTQPSDWATTTPT